MLGEDGIEQLLKVSIDCALDIKAVRPAELVLENLQEEPGEGENYGPWIPRRTVLLAE